MNDDHLWLRGPLAILSKGSVGVVSLTVCVSIRYGNRTVRATTADNTRGLGFEQPPEATWGLRHIRPPALAAVSLPRAHESTHSAPCTRAARALDGNLVAGRVAVAEGGDELIGSRIELGSA